MNDVQETIRRLIDAGWTQTALGDELGVTNITVYRWLHADRYPQNAKAVMIVLDSLTRRKRIPKQRRYKPGSRTRKDS